VVERTILEHEHDDVLDRCELVAGHALLPDWRSDAPRGSAGKENAVSAGQFASQETTDRRQRPWIMAHALPSRDPASDNKGRRADSRSLRLIRAGAALHRTASHRVMLNITN
jgi:hypothetical protein